VGKLDEPSSACAKRRPQKAACGDAYTNSHPYENERAAAVADEPAELLGDYMGEMLVEST
jgi:hypothetical protein